MSSKKINEDQTLFLKKTIIKNKLSKRKYDEADYELIFSKVNKNNLNYLILDFNFINRRKETFTSIQIEEKNVKILLDGLNK